jgi:acyl-coA thioester hydrolase, ybgC/ybaW family
MRIYYEDTDAGGIVYHTNYIKFCERARSEMFFSSGLSFDESSNFVVTNLNAKFIKPAVLGDVIEIRSIVADIKKVSIILRQEIFKVGHLNQDCNEILLFSCDTHLAHISFAKLSKIENNILSFLKTNDNFIFR